VMDDDFDFTSARPCILLRRPAAAGAQRGRTGNNIVSSEKFGVNTGCSSNAKFSEKFGVATNVKCSSSAAHRATPPKVRRAPAALDLVHEKDVLDAPAVRVRNTFIDNAVPLSPSLQAFYRERRCRTCPSKQIGLLSYMRRDSFKTYEGNSSTESPPVSYCNISTPCSDLGFIDAFNSIADNTEKASPHSTAPEKIQANAGMMVHKDCNMEEHSQESPGNIDGDDVSSPSPYCQEDGEIECLPDHSNVDLPGSKTNCSTRTVLNLTQALKYEHEAPLSQEPKHREHYNEFLAAPLKVNPVLVEPVAPVGGGLALLPPVPARYPPASTPTLVASPRNLPPAPQTQVVPPVGSLQLPSIGSVGHGVGGSCKPCAFFHKKGCSNKEACDFCHLCGADELKRRRREKLEMRRVKASSERAASKVEITPAQVTTTTTED